MVRYIGLISEFNDYDNKGYLNNKKKYSSNSALVCSICGSNQIITDTESGETICSNCGQVLLDKILETQPEPQNFPESYGSNDRSRTGMSTSLARHDMGL